MIDALKVKANSMDVPYKSLIKMLLNEGLLDKRVVTHKLCCVE